MFFLALVPLLSLALLTQAFAGLSPSERTRRPRHAALNFVAGMCLCAGMALLVVAVPGPGGSVAVGGRNWAVFAFCAGGLLGSMAFGWEVLLRGLVGKGPGQTWRFGVALWGGIGCLYVVGTTIDHWMFFADPERTAVVYAIEEMQISDVQCTRPLLVRLEGQRAVYRCPNLVMLGGMYAVDPFVPWPSYAEGESTQIVGAMAAMTANAFKLPR